MVKTEEMTKQATAEYLSKLGYCASHENGGVVIYFDKPLGHGKKDRIRNILRSVGYKGKWAWKLRKQEPA
jgi:hypothetical protein